jgi:hypothetical protein
LLEEFPFFSSVINDLFARYYYYLLSRLPRT